MQWHSSYPRDETIGNHRWNFTGNELVLTILAPARNHVVTLIKFIEQASYVCGIVLQIGIHGNQHRAARRMYTGRHRCGLSIVSTQRNYANARIYFGEPPQHLQASVS